MPTEKLFRVRSQSSSKNFSLGQTKINFFCWKNFFERGVSPLQKIFPRKIIFYFKKKNVCFCFFQNTHFCAHGQTPFWPKKAISPLVFWPFLAKKGLFYCLNNTCRFSFLPPPKARRGGYLKKKRVPGTFCSPGTRQKGPFLPYRHDEKFSKIFKFFQTFSHAKKIFLMKNESCLSCQAATIASIASHVKKLQCQ